MYRKEPNILAVTVQIHVKEDHLDRVLEALDVQAKTSRREEPGCLRFEVFRDMDDPRTIFIHEIYATREDLERHRTTEHFGRWRGALQDALAGERVTFHLDPTRVEL